MNVLMPQLGETVTTGTLLRWFKEAGASVRADEPLFEVETDKVVMEIPAPAAGLLVRILVPAGETVDVGTTLAELSPDTIELGTTIAASPATANGQLSPVVRRLLAEHGLDTSEIRATGNGGRLTRDDVLAHVARTKTSAQPAVLSNSPPQATPEFIPFNSLRQRIGAHMVRSKATSPHVLQAVEVDFDAVNAARESHPGLTYLPFIAHSVCRTIKDFPLINATVEAGGLRVERNVNLAIAVDLSFAGLLAPVLRNAHLLSVQELARGIHDIAERARRGELSPDDLAGGTYTISNSGKFGTLITAPIINQPQVAILSMDGVRRRPVALCEHGEERIAIRPVGVLAQSFDHRAFDGAYSAAFLDALRQRLERTQWTQQLMGAT